MKQPIPTFQADIVDKRVKMSGHVRKAMSLWIGTFKNGSHIEIIIKKYREKRTNDQNAYYWGTVIPISADHFGHDNPEEMHEDFKLEFNPVESKVAPGKIIGGSTTKMSTTEFFSDETSFVNRICRWMATENGVYIPPPQKEGA